MDAHRWSGWPGAFCLRCGIEDPLETLIAIEVINPPDEGYTDFMLYYEAIAICKVCYGPSVPQL
jgi:hypothetical protein